MLEIEGEIGAGKTLSRAHSRNKRTPTYDKSLHESQHQFPEGFVTHWPQRIVTFILFLLSLSPADRAIIATAAIGINITNSVSNMGTKHFSWPCCFGLVVIVIFTGNIYTQNVISRNKGFIEFPIGILGISSSGSPFDIERIAPAIQVAMEKVNTIYLNSSYKLVAIQKTYGKYCYVGEGPGLLEFIYYLLFYVIMRESLFIVINTFSFSVTIIQQLIQIDGYPLKILLIFKG